MTTKTIAQKTAELLRMEVDFDTENDTASAILSCARYILRELTEQYVDLIATDTVTVADKKISFSALSKTPVHILSVKQKDSVRFREYPTYIKVPREGTYEVTYSYFLHSLGTGDVVTLPPKYTEDVLSLGVASEYLYRTGYTDDAALFGERYYTALKNLSSTRKEIVLPARRFL